MRYTALKFWAKLDAIHQFTSTEDIFLKTDRCYFHLLQVPHHNNTMFNKIIKVD